MTRAFTVSTKGSRVERAEEALSHMGSSVSTCLLYRGGEGVTKLELQTMSISSSHKDGLASLGENK